LSALPFPAAGNRPGRTWRLLRAVVTSLLAGLLLATGTPASAGLETALEKLIGRQAAVALAEQFGTESDPLLADWVKRVGDRVSAVSPRKDVRYRIQVIEMDEPNALALPGGYIFVTKGLLEFIHDDDELASIIAHEVGHVVGRHGIRHIEHQILAALLISQIRDRGGEMAGLGATLLDALLALQRSRKDELAADRMSVEYAARAGYDPAGLLSFFNKIRRPDKPSWLDTLFATHPPAEKRIEHAQKSSYFHSPSRETLIAIGDRLASEGRYNKALEKYREAAKQGADDAELNEKIALALAAQGRQSETMALQASGGSPLAPAHSPEAPRRAFEEAMPAHQAVLAVHRDLSERQRLLVESGQRTQKRLRNASQRHEWTRRLEAAMLGMPQGLDTRWIYVAARCLALSTEVDSLLRSGWRGVRQANAAMHRATAVCAQAASETDPARYLSRDLLSSIALDMERAGKESIESLARIDRAIPDLAEADRIVAGVMADLNSPYVVPWANPWGHLAALEGFLQHASSCLRRARGHVEAGLRYATRARARSERAALDIADAAASPAEHAIFRTLVRTRLGVTDTAIRDLVGRGHSLGDATVMLLYTRSAGESVSGLEASHQAGASWVETAERMGLSPETQAIVLRLLNNTIAEEKIPG